MKSPCENLAAKSTDRPAQDINRDHLKRMVRSHVRKFETYIFAAVERRLDSFARTLELDLCGRLTDDADSRAVFDAIAGYVTARFDLKPGAVWSRLRTERLVMPRHVCFYFCRMLTNATLNEIGRHFVRNHGSILNGCHNVQERMDTNPGFKKQIEEMERELRSDLQLDA